MSKATIYLAGPISGLTFKEALEWREEAARLLQPQWRVINPCRAEKYKREMDEVVVQTTQEDKDLDLTLTATGICAQDEFFIDQSDWLFCNFLGAKLMSGGTLWEMGYGYAKGKKILSVIEPGSISDIAWTRRRSHLFTASFDEAIDYFQTIAI